MSGNASRGMLVLFPFLVGFACPATAAREARVSETYGKLPLHFEANRGQTHEDVRFLARGPGYSLFLTPTGAALTLTKQVSPARKPAAHGKSKPRGPATGTVLRMTFAGANPDPRVTGLEELPGKANYFIGNDPAKWRTSVPTYAKVRYADLYPRIDLLYYGNQRQLEYDLVVRPGADPTRIVLDIQGAERLQVDAQGDLVLHTSVGPIRQRKPVIHQELDGVRKDIPGGYVLKGEHQVGFKVAAYDASQALVIDPVLSYSTYLGGSGAIGDYGAGIAVDASGNAYVTGGTSSSDFPTTAGAFQTTFGGDVFGGGDAFVTKLNPTGSALVYSTYLGGSGHEAGHGIAVDAAGNAYMTGYTSSTNVPTTPAAIQTTYSEGGLYSGGDAFVTKLNAAGSALVYSTYLGGRGTDMGRAIALQYPNVYVTGHTESYDFPTTTGAFQTMHDAVSGTDVFVAKIADIMSPPAPTPAARADFNGDGKADILWRNSSTGENYVWLMNGTTITGKGSVRTEPDQNWKVAGVGDFNGDGTADILWRYSSTGENYVYLMNGTTITGEGYLAETDLNWQVAGVGEFNGDGRAAILWRK